MGNEDRPKFEVDDARTTTAEDGKVVHFPTRDSAAKVLEWATGGSLIDEDGDWAEGKWNNQIGELPYLLSLCRLEHVDNLPPEQLEGLVLGAVSDYNESLGI
jgi:hypothetical protein